MTTTRSITRHRQLGALTTLPTCIVVLVGCCVALVRCEFQHTPVLRLDSQGLVRGLVLEADDGVLVHLYQGIRYGKAKRFEKPVAAEPWPANEVYNATTFQYACPQADYPIANTVDKSRGLETGTSNEDCLFLNVWTPSKAMPVGYTRPVMVYLHGGSFESGTIFNAIYDSRFLAAQGDVVVVTVNYRLGPFGFLYGGIESAPGNAGLYDQLLALQWVQSNVHHFGGDPHRVTLFGQSAGAMSAGALILSPRAKGLFHRVIMQSGAPNSYFGSTGHEAGLAKAKVLATKLRCPTTDLTEMVSCLKGKSATDILEHTKLSQLNGESFVPTYNTELMPVPPVQALKLGKFNRVDLMYGVVRDEGAGFVTKLLPLLDPDSDGHELTLDNVRTIIGFMYQMFQEPYYKEVADFYTKHLNESDKLLLRRTVAYSFADYHLVCPTTFFGEQLAKQAPEKKYYAYRVDLPPSIGVMGCHGWMGVCHGSDVIYVFGIPQRIHGLVFSEPEYELSRQMTKAWASFARSGQPGTVQTEGSEVKWTEALQAIGEEHFTSPMALDSNHYRVLTHPYRDVCNGFFKTKLFV